MYFRKEEKEAESDKLSWLDPPQQDHELYAPGAHAEGWGGGSGLPPPADPPLFHIACSHRRCSKGHFERGTALSPAHPSRGLT